MLIVLLLFHLSDYELSGVSFISQTLPSCDCIIYFCALCLHSIAYSSTRVAPCLARISEVDSGRSNSSKFPMCSHFLGVKMIGL